MFTFVCYPVFVKYSCGKGSCFIWSQIKRRGREKWIEEENEVKS